MLYFRFPELIHLTTESLYPLTNIFPPPPTTSLLYFFFFFFVWLHGEAYRILVPRPGIKPTAPAVEAQSLNHWTTKEVIYYTFLSTYYVPGIYIHYVMALYPQAI